MKALFLIVAVLFAVRAEAATPSGCYATYSNPNFCYGGQIDFFYSSESDNITYYGFTVGSLINELMGTRSIFITCDNSLSQTRALLDSCHSLYESKNAEVVQCANAFNALYSDYTSCGAAFRTADLTVSSLKRQIKALKRRCGSRCR